MKTITLTDEQHKNVMNALLYCYDSTMELLQKNRRNLNGAARDGILELSHTYSDLIDIFK